MTRSLMCTMVFSLTAACNRTPPPVEAPPVEPVATAPSPDPAPPPAAVSEPHPGRIVAIGDVHGDLNNAQAVAKLAGLIDDEGHWAGGTTIFVQTGDTTDRGDDSGAIMAWLRELEKEAKAAGGQVVPLLGNHEVMNIAGDWRYVTPGDIEAYGGKAPREAAFGVEGPDGAWLRTLGVAAKVGDTVFAHGGIRTQYAKLGIDGLNDLARTSIANDPKAPVLSENGPLWYRGYVTEDEEVACTLLANALAALEARRMVVGHTTRRDGKVQSRCSGSLLVIDIGIAKHYGSNLGAIEVVAGDAAALYPTGRIDLEDPQ